MVCHNHQVSLCEIKLKPNKFRVSPLQKFDRGVPHSILISVEMQKKSEDSLNVQGFLEDAGWFAVILLIRKLFELQQILRTRQLLNTVPGYHVFKIIKDNGNHCEIWEKTNDYLFLWAKGSQTERCVMVNLPPVHGEPPTLYPSWCLDGLSIMIHHSQYPNLRPFPKTPEAAPSTQRWAGTR